MVFYWNKCSLNNTPFLFQILYDAYNSYFARNKKPDMFMVKRMYDVKRVGEYVSKFLGDKRRPPISAVSQVNIMMILKTVVFNTSERITIA